MALNRDERFPSPDDVPDDAILEQLQGNIVRAFGGSRSKLILLRFGTDIEENRKWVRDNVLRGITSAKEQQERRAGEVFRNFFVTSAGLQRLGCKTQDGFDRAFLRGMRADATRSRLNDPPPETWAPEFRSPWHCMLVLAFDGELAKSDMPNLEGGAVLESHVEDGNTLDGKGAPLNGKGPRYEPFGFRDDVSSIALCKEHEEALKARRASGKWDEGRPLSIALAADPLASSPAAYGSYFVFRKLAQDVAGFRARLDVIVEELRKQGPRLNLLFGGKPTHAYGIFAPGGDAAAQNGPPRDVIEAFVRKQIIGRSAEGAPAVLDDENPTNDFNYADDPDGRKCPFSAHIRKCNPRGLTGDLDGEKSRTFLRRGIPFGRADGNIDPRIGCGLLFLCAQSDIEEQYEFIQMAWANDARYWQKVDAIPTPDKDNLIAQTSNVDTSQAYASGAKGDVRYDRGTRFDRLTHTMEFDFRMYQFVSLQGGEYFFAPSIAGLNRLVGK
jgi:deferrochelatase/peroxidase EfeB